MIKVNFSKPLLIQSVAFKMYSFGWMEMGLPKPMVQVQEK